MPLLYWSTDGNRPNQFRHRWVNMTTTLLFALFLPAQLVIFVLDGWELRRQGRRAASPRGQRERGPLLLLGVTTVGFFLIQVTGSWLMPRPLDILDAVRAEALTWASVEPGPVGHVATLSPLAACGLGVLLFYVAGLWDYAIHRLLSHSRWFWFTHEYHHLPNQVNVWMPGILVRPFAFLPATLSTVATAATMYGLLLACRLPCWDLRPFLPVLLAVTTLLTASHSVFLRRFNWVHRLLSCLWLTTPQEHLLHHAQDSQVNYGNFTTLWDRVFGTYRSPRGVDLDQVPLGLSYDRDFLGTITLGWCSLSADQRRRYHVARFCNVREAAQAP